MSDESDWMGIRSYELFRENVFLLSEFHNCLASLNHKAKTSFNNIGLKFAPSVPRVNIAPYLGWIFFKRTDDIHTGANFTTRGQHLPLGANFTPGGQLHLLGVVVRP
jgi:hypothetical protein